MSKTSTPPENPPNLRDTLLSVAEELLEIQLSSVRKLQGKPGLPSRSHRAPQQRLKGMSHIDMAFDVLASAPGPLHISAIIKGIETHFGLRIDSESLVSALSKRIARKDRFVRTAPNTFGLLIGRQPPGSAPAPSPRHPSSSTSSPSPTSKPPATTTTTRNESKSKNRS